jgi:uncharacterized membrane protein
MITLFLILLIIAILFKIFPPTKINSIYGYRTKKSKKNITNWKIANKYSANLLLFFTSSLFLISLFLYLLNLEFDNILIGLFLLSLVLMIVLTEKKLTEL